MGLYSDLQDRKPRYISNRASSVFMIQAVINFGVRRSNDILSQTPSKETSSKSSRWFETSGTLVALWPWWVWVTEQRLWCYNVGLQFCNHTIVLTTIIPFKRSIDIHIDHSLPTAVPASLPRYRRINITNDISKHPVSPNRLRHPAKLP